MELIEIRALEDNFIWLYAYNPQNAFVIDPSDAEIVIQTLKNHNLSLTAILLTHHHWDHVGGINALKKLTGCQVIAADTRITETDRIVKNDEIINFDKINLKVIATPGHTRKSVCYYLPPSENIKPTVWTGDTLFIGGCGRVFETDMETMWNSLNKLKSLPEETIICPSHDYTVENYEFALTIEPDNEQIKIALDRARRSNPTVSTMGHELKTNIFLQANDPQDFSKLRHKKDAF